MPEFIDSKAGSFDSGEHAYAQEGTPPVGGLESRTILLQLRCSAKGDIPFTASQLAKKREIEDRIAEEG